jgi:formylglycine-generating enzyme required for sulfatase activity
MKERLGLRTTAGAWENVLRAGLAVVERALCDSCARNRISTSRDPLVPVGCGASYRQSAHRRCGEIWAACTEPTMIPLTLAAFTLSACAPKTTDDTADSGDSDTDADTDADSDADSDTDSDTDTDTDTDTDFVKVPASTFLMGCTEGQSDCDPGETEHSVTLTHDYFVGVTEVTQGQFEATMGYNPSAFTGCGADCPVEDVSWYESAAYANAMSDAAGLSQCYTCTGGGDRVECDVAANPYDCDGYRLLTEAEWEGAARCGTDLLYAGSDNILGVGWILDNSGDTTHAVGGLAPNACGLYDMSGNVFEWTQDLLGYYGSGAATDPTGPDSGSYRIIRGGGWNDGASFARVSARFDGRPVYARDSLGFRLGRSSP